MSQIDPLKKHRHTQETAKRTQSPEAQRERERDGVVINVYYA
jgi:hypothetical protein